MELDDADSGLVKAISCTLDVFWSGHDEMYTKNLKFLDRSLRKDCEVASGSFLFGLRVLGLGREMEMVCELAS